MNATRPTRRLPPCRYRCCSDTVGQGFFRYPAAVYKETEMMKFGKSVGSALVASIFLLAYAGCEKKEGPMEQAGKSVDKATEKVGEKIEKAGENIQDAAKGEKK